MSMAAMFQLLWCISSALNASFIFQKHMVECPVGPWEVCVCPWHGIIISPILPMCTAENNDVSFCINFQAAEEDVWKHSILTQATMTFHLHRRICFFGIMGSLMLGYPPCIISANMKCSPPAYCPSNLLPLIILTTLPCIFNIPGSVCDNLFWMACKTAKAMHKCPSVHPAYNAPSSVSMWYQFRRSHQLWLLWVFSCWPCCHSLWP